MEKTKTLPPQPSQNILGDGRTSKEKKVESLSRPNDDMENMDDNRPTETLKKFRGFY